MKYILLIGLAIGLISFSAHQTLATDTATEDPYAYLGKGKQDLLFQMAAEHVEILAPNVTEVNDAFIEQHKRVIAAMVKVLDKNGPVANALTKQHHALNTKYYQHLTGGEFGHTSIVDEQTSRESTDSIVLNRQSDLRALSGMLTPERLMAAFEKYKGTREARRSDFSLSEKGKEKLVVTVLQPKQFDRGEPAVHMYATAKGHLLEHAILARAFAPGGEVEKAMVSALQAELKDMDPAKVAAIAQHYIGDRYYFATRVVKSLALDGDVMQEALKRSKISQRKYD